MELSREANPTLVIEPKTSVLKGNLPPIAAQLTFRLEGRKSWATPYQLKFETSGANIEAAMSLIPTAVVQDRRASLASTEAFDTESRQRVTHVEPNFRFTPFGFQLENFEKFKNQLAWAIYSVQGSGKTKTSLDIICHRYLAGTVTGVIILSSPKGVHAQWVNEQMPKHMWTNVPHLAMVWEGKKPPAWLGTETEELQIISGNIDMLRGNGLKHLEVFANQHKSRLLILVDEADSIKNLSTQRSKSLRKLAEGTKQRAIMTGTPIAKDLTDEFAQFYFLDPDIIGHKYLTSFRAQYCVMGGFEGKAVVGHKNIEQFKRQTAPYIFRATKADLGLPPKVYDEVVFDLAPEQKTIIRSIRENFFAETGEGNSMAVSAGAIALLRVQQVSNGFAVLEDGTVKLLANPRLEALKSLRQSIAGPVIIWCRFKKDIEIVMEAFKGTSVAYYGETSSPDRILAKEAFIEGRATELVATAGAAGKGVDGLQKVCSDAIYYSNSFNAIDRWQSEDRIDRIGGNGTSTYFDLVGRGSVDRAILRNLKSKQDISRLALDDIRKIMDEVL